ncbi:Uma2 family endonuclease [Desulfosporosinus shakirovi]|uniref:Uma2 family endonuclease n=1 Tax=Desulfosporosinus shakirovi TaxID=2885154 RepID=UPI001E6364FB|nr:Uma2 family endonuclease [Desulfosporosinus sp. SRJS8]MCB8815350.1 Uma2 family endonuclease [Desulfosporosinus sp. SRJS8]
MPLPQKERQYTYADYLAWPEDERVEIIEGVPYMQATPSPEHQEISMNLSTQISVYLKGKPCKVYAAPFSVRLIKGDEKEDEDVKNVFEPDITVVCDQSKIDKQGCKGIPDLIIEIISPSSIKHDRVTKFNQYEKAGVLEYWIVEPEGKLVSVFLLQSNGRYGRPEIYTEEETINVGIFPELTIDLNGVFPSVL